MFNLGRNLLSPLKNSITKRSTINQFASLINVQKRDKVTFVEKLPPGEFESLGEHGSSDINIKAMEEHGINPNLTGKNFGKGSQGGPGLYVTTNKDASDMFAANASIGKKNSQPQKIDIFAEKSEKRKSVIMPEKTFYNPEKIREFSKQNHEAHDIDLGETKKPPELGGKGKTTLITQRGIEDPNVNYYAIKQPKKPQEEAFKTISKLSENTQKKFAHMRKTGSTLEENN